MPQTAQEAAAQNAAELPPVSPDASPLPLAPELPHRQDTATAERVMERIDAAQTRKASKKAAHKAQRDATVKEKSSRLQFTEEELSTPELEKYIRKSNEAADRLDAAKAAIPKEKKLVKERTFDEATGKAKTRQQRRVTAPGGARDISTLMKYPDKGKYRVSTAQEAAATMTKPSYRP